MVRSNSGVSSPVEGKVVEIPLLTRVENGGNTGGDRRISSISRMLVKCFGLLALISVKIGWRNCSKQNAWRLIFAVRGFSFFLV